MAYTPDMQDGTKRPEPTWSTIRDQVRDAEALGYDTILAVETQHDPYLELAIAAQEPSKIELATGIALAYTKSPGRDRVHCVGFAAHERRAAEPRTRIAGQRSRDAALWDAVVEARAADERLRRCDARVLEDLADAASRSIFRASITISR